MSKPLSFASITLALALAGPPAHAREPNDQAKRLDKLGKKAYAAKDWDEAIASFEAAFDADPLPKFLFNIGRSYEKKGDVPKAIESFERYLSEAKEEADQADAKDRLAILTKKREKGGARVEIGTEPAGAALRLRSGDDTRTAEGTLSGWLPVGTWQVSASLRGYAARSVELDVQPGKPVELTLTLEEASGDDEPAPEPTGPGQAPPPPPSGGGGSLLPWIAMGSGALLLGAGGLFGFLNEGAMDRLKELEAKKPVTLGEIEAEEKDAKTYGIVANSLFVAGVLAGAGGAVTSRIRNSF